MTKQIYSIGQLAKECGVEIHVLRYCLKSRHIQPIDTVGGKFVYSSDQLPRIKSELARMAQAKACH
ncbi:MAG: MerR family transcriptional regulator [Phycisphaerae bacterium]|nr:MerR family transcriptional regulator [Phycisphaerae bacterium]